MPRFVEVHVLQWFPLSCINRDDAGLPKSMTLGGERRARWSSQSQKYALRKAFAEGLATDNLRMKTRRLPIMGVEVLVRRGRDETQSAQRVTAAVLALGLNLNPSKQAVKNADDEEGVGEPDEDVEAFGCYLTGRTQVILPVPQAGAEILADAVEKHWDVLGGAVDLGKNFKGKAKSAVAGHIVKAVSADTLKALDAARLVDVALFGRFLSEVPTETVDATCSVAHGFTTHPDDFETEFWSAVDDDQASQGHGGSANMGSQGLTSGTFYRYGVIDLDAFASGRLADDQALVQAGVREFVRRFAALRPRAMVHSTAPYVDPATVLATVTDSPRMLGDAFVRPVEDGDYLKSSARRLAKTWDTSLQVYDAQVRGFSLSGHPDTADVQFTSATAIDTLDALVDAVAGAAFDA